MGSVSFVASTASVVIDGTSISVTLPSGIQNNDGVVVCLVSRSTVTPASGWTLITSATVTYSGTSHTISLYRKNTVTSADSSTTHTFSQSVYEVFEITAYVWRGTSGVVRYGNYNVAAEAFSYGVTVPYTVSSRTYGTFMGVITRFEGGAPLRSPAALTGWTTTTAADYGLRTALYYSDSNAYAAGDGITSTYLGAPGGTLSYGTAGIILNLVDSQDTSGVSDTVGISETRIASKQFTGSLTDQHVLTDAATWVGTYEMVLTEGIGLTRNVLAVVPKMVSVTDVVRLRRQLSSGLPVFLVQGTSMADAARGAYGLASTETVGMFDPTQTRTTFGVSAQDAQALADQARIGRVVGVSDAVGLARAVAVARGLALGEQLTLQPIINPDAKFGVTATERLRLADSLRNFFGGEILDVIGIALSQQATKRVTPIVTEAGTVTETVARKLVLQITSTDTVGVDEAEQLQSKFRPTLSDVVGIVGGQFDLNDSTTTWAVNARTGAVTEYLNYPFNSFAEMGQGRYIAASSTGIYQLHGDDDDGTPIVARVKSGLAQFSGSLFIGLKAVYLGMRGSGEVFLKLETGDGSSFTYQTTVASMETTKVLVGKGLRTRYLSFELVNKDGQDFDLDTVEFVPMWAQRRV